MYIGDYYVLISYLQNDIFKQKLVPYLSIDFTTPLCFLCYQPIVLFIALWHTSPFRLVLTRPVTYHHSISCIGVFRNYMYSNFTPLTVVTCCVPSIPFCPGLLCNVLFWPIPSRPIVYRHVAMYSVCLHTNICNCPPLISIAYRHNEIHSVPFRHNMIHWLPSNSILYHHVVVHSIPLRPNMIEWLPPRSIVYHYISIHFIPLPPNLIYWLLPRCLVSTSVPSHIKFFNAFWNLIYYVIL